MFSNSFINVNLASPTCFAEKETHSDNLSDFLQKVSVAEE